MSDKVNKPLFLPCPTQVSYWGVPATCFDKHQEKQAAFDSLHVNKKVESFDSNPEKV